MAGIGEPRLGGCRQADDGERGGAEPRGGDLTQEVR